MKTNRWFFLQAIPVLWGVCSLVHFRFPGDEYAMYAISSIAGAWTCWVIRIGDIHQWWIPFSVALAGSCVMAGVGWLLNWLGVRKRVWLALFGISVITIFVLMLSSYPSVQRALSKNGSWWAYICSSVLLGTYLAAPLSVLATLAFRWIKRRSRPTQPPAP